MENVMFTLILILSGAVNEYLFVQPHNATRYEVRHMEQNKIAENDTSNQQSVDALARSIDSCPAWSEIDKDDSATRSVILHCLDKISASELSIIRAAMGKFISDKRSANNYNVASMSKLFVLNRYLFDAPSKAPFNRSTFGGWVGVPSTDREINWLWPLSIDSAGNLKLTGTFRGYMGDDYLALEEFDYFNKTFRRRR